MRRDFRAERTEMERQTHHIFPNGHGGWFVRREGDATPIVNTDTKIKAIRIGIELSRHPDALVVTHAQERRSLRLGSVPAVIPFPFPFSDRQTGRAGGQAGKDAGKPRRAAVSTAAESHATFDFDSGARQ